MKLLKDEDWVVKCRVIEAFGEIIISEEKTLREIVKTLVDFANNENLPVGVSASAILTLNRINQLHILKSNGLPDEMRHRLISNQEVEPMITNDRFFISKFWNSTLSIFKPAKINEFFSFIQQNPFIFLCCCTLSVLAISYFIYCLVGKQNILYNEEPLLENELS